MRSRPHRVLVVEPESYPGGMWHYANAFSRALRRAGVEVFLATVSPFEALPGSEELEIYSIGTRVSRTGVPRLYDRAHRHLGKLAGLRRIVERVRPDIVHVLNGLGKLDFLFFAFLRRRRIRVVYTAHDVNPGPDESPSRWYDWARYRRCDAIVALSLRAVHDLTSGGIERSKIVHVHHGDYLEYCKDEGLTRDQARAALGLAPDAGVLLFFGTIAPYKGLDVLVDAFAIVANRNPRARLIIAGEPLEDFAPYRQRVEKLGLDGAVICDLRYIPLDEIPRYFAACDVVALPYRTIYQSGVLQLAYGFSRPVVATDVGGLGVAVAEDGTGIVVAKNEPEALASAILALLADPTTAAEMGSRGRQLAATKYAWDEVARTMVETYVSLLASGGGGPGGRRTPHSTHRGGE